MSFLSLDLKTGTTRTILNDARTDIELFFNRERVGDIIANMDLIIIVKNVLIYEYLFLNEKNHFICRFQETGI